MPYASLIGRFLKLLLLENKNVFVFKNIEPADQRPVPPKLFLIPLSTRLFEVLNYDALQRKTSFEHFIHTIEPKGNPFSLRILVADNQCEIPAALEHRSNIVEHRSNHLQKFFGAFSV